MSKIHVLPPEIVSKIAAGEIIERPASVVKELVENSIDAGATSIEFILKDAGKTSLKIKDNGCGIEQDDLKNIFLRHSTSKIQNIEDLYSIMSLGFRGEALYSIASIADVILSSKTKDQTEGWETHVRGGKEINTKPCTFPSHGTEIAINELFFNTPARKKFMKSNTTEIHQVLGTLIPYTLYHNNIHFVLNHQGKDLISVQPSKNYADRLADVLNIDPEHIIEDVQDLSDKKLKVHMLLGDINLTRSRRDMQFIFINGRPIQNKSISFHMNQIYRLIMPQGTSPLFCLFLDLPAEDIDVNIHPAKREVKFKDEQGICSVLRSVCEQALMQKGSIKQVSAEKLQQPKISTYDATEQSEYQPTQTNSTVREPSEYSYPTVTAKSRTTPQEQSEFFLAHAESIKQNSGSLKTKLMNAIYIGSFANKYLLFESNQTLLLIDQHAAQERITYERLVKQMQSGQLEVQRLLSPVLIKLSPQELLVWEESQDKLDDLGLENNQWDEHTIAVHSHPLLIGDIEKSVRELLAGGNIAKCDHDEIARRACRSSVMAGDAMNKDQAEYQRTTLTDCLDPFTCPHGRPTVIEISLDFLDKQFLRT